jgi:hypothetical protein
MAVDSELLTIVHELTRIGIKWDERHRMKGTCPNGYKVNVAAKKLVGSKISFSSLFVRDSHDLLVFGKQYLTGAPDHVENDPETQEYLWNWIVQSSN